MDFKLTTTSVTFRNSQKYGDVFVQIEDDELGEAQEVFELEILDVSPDTNNFRVRPYIWRVYINDDDGGIPDDGPGDRQGDGQGDGGAGKALKNNYLFTIM